MSRRRDISEKIKELLGRALEGPRVHEQLDYKYIISRQIMRCVEAEDDYEFEHHVRRLLSLIPEAYRDNDFKRDLEEAKVVEKVVIPAKFAGVEVLNNPNIPPMEEEVETYDWDAVLQAILGLFSRRRRLEAERVREVVIYD